MTPLSAAAQPEQLFITLLSQRQLVSVSFSVSAARLWMTCCAAVKNVPRLLKLHPRHTHYGLNTHAHESIHTQDDPKTNQTASVHMTPVRRGQTADL